MNQWPLLSVIVPVYGTEKFLRKCLDSLLSETYPNMEIIIVNDGSPDNAFDIIEEYKNKYSNIKYVKNPKNQGLFKARLRGYEVASGEYICSVDSDDFVGVDYHRQLMIKALESQADIVVSKFIIYDAEKNNYTYRTYGNYAIEQIDLSDESILETFFQTNGKSSHWWFVWNKVYKKKIWDLAYNDLLKLDKHLIMLEDYIYGIAFMYYAQRYVSVDEDSYFYVKHASASTGNSGGYEKLYKNIHDQIEAFKFVKNFLEEKNILANSERGFIAFKEKQMRAWRSITGTYNLSYEEKISIFSLLSQISGNINDKADKTDTFFYVQCTPWDNRIEELKKQILSTNIKYVSFDMFDTLILRPFLQPTDLFVCLTSLYDKLVPNSKMQDFVSMRINAEREARNIYKEKHRFEDITLEEIYCTFSKLYNISSEISNTLMREEENLEIKFCTTRKKVKEIYEFALFCGKKVICTTDIYLNRNTINAILHKNGYFNFCRIFISSEERLSKVSGHLYDVLLEELQAEPKEVLHIGDNWTSDILMAQKKMLLTAFVPKAVSLFNNTIPDVNGKKARGSFFASMSRNSFGSFSRYNYSQKYFGIRCMLGLIANKIFDNPFLSYEPWTDFNRNPYYVGYYALGMHVYGIVQWLIQLCKDKKYETIHFVARDGYAAKLVYEIVRSYEPDLPKINYFYMSRKSLLPLTVKEAADLYNISEFLPYKGKTPLDIIELIKPILNWDEEKKYIYANRGIILNKIIETDEEYKQFISSVIELSYSQENNNSYRAKMKCYFSSILGKNDVMFDIGYSGRAQAILSSLLGYGINAAYIHYLGDQVLCYAKRFNFQADSYYEHVPVIIGKIREVIQSDIIGSCIGYTIDQDPIQPILEESNYSYQGRFVIQRIHQGMQDFVKDFMQVFSEYQQLMTWQKSDLGFAHEYYLHYPKGQDMNMFSVIQFEDDVLHNKQYRKQYLSDLWWNDLKWNNLLIKNRQTNCFIQLTAFPRWKRICYYALFERKTLKDKVIARCDNHPYLYKILHISYVSLRKTYYSVKKIKNKTKSIDNMANLSISNKHNCIKDKQNMDGKNKVFYYACSEYGILCCLMHRLKYYTEKECVLMISGWRKNRYESLRASGLFKEVQIFDDLSLRKIAHRIDNEIKRDEQKQINRFFEEYINEFESRLPYKLDSFEKIIIHNNTMPIGIYLEKNNIHYEALEDAAGIYSNPYLLLNSIKTTFPLIEQMLLKEYSIPEVSLCCDKWYINYLAQSQNFNKEKTEHFSVIKILEEMDDLTKSKVLSIFSIIPTSIKSNEETALILTYPLSTRLGITEEDQKTIYALLADIFADNKKKYLKPHPDDHTNYDDFGDINLIPSGVLSELLVYETGEHFNLALSTISTALNNLQDIERKVYFGDELIREYPNIIKYYIISHYISQYCSPTAKIIGSNISIEILHSISLYSDARYLQDPQVYTVDESFKISCDKIFVIGPATERKQIDTIKNSLLNNDCIISFNEFPGADILHIEKKKLCGGYLINLNNEKLFVYSKIGINKKFDFQKIMKTLNIKLTCTWTYEK